MAEDQNWTVGTFKRVELIDHSQDAKGRCFVKYGDLKVELSVQDGRKTLKVFVSNKEPGSK